MDMDDGCVHSRRNGRVAMMDGSTGINSGR
jgi:hypothetical protein